MKRSYIFNIIFLLIIFSARCFSQPFVSFQLKNQTYHKGRTFTVEADYYFNRETGNLVVHSFLPKENIKITNRLGEFKVFFPQENAVTSGQNKVLSSENELVYYFLSNNFYDLGLSKEGFTIEGSEMDANYQVITWKCPLPQNLLLKIKLVSENGRPVFAAYYGKEGKIIRKIYYYNYEVFTDFMLPLKVSQITYTPDGDSIVQRNTYSNLRLSHVEPSELVNFKIPDNAKIME